MANVNVKCYTIHHIAVNEDGTDQLEYELGSNVDLGSDVANAIVEGFKSIDVPWVAIKVTDDSGIHVYERLGDRRLQVWHNEEVSDLLA